MAAGDTLALWHPNANIPPSVNWASLDTRNRHPVLDFDATTDEEAVFGGVMPQAYSGNGVTVRIYWSATSATSGNCIWDAIFEATELDLDDVDADDFQPSVNSVTDAAPTVSGFVTRAEIPFTNGTDMNNVGAGDMFRLKIRRDASADSMSGDAELHRVELLETP